MKFLCDNCKAKYQIGDEKVAGKSVRMQCRRCGHLIQVSASVTESSVAQALPVEPPRAAGDDAHLAPPSDEAPAAGTGAPAAGAASRAKAPPASSLGQVAAPSPPRPATQPLPRPGGAPRPPVAPRAVPDPVARPAPGLAGASGLSVPSGASGLSGPSGASSASGLSGASSARPATAPQAPPVARAAQPAPGKPATAAAPAPRGAEPASAASPSRGAAPTSPAGVAGVFKRSMSDDRPLAKAPAVRSTSSEDWYVGVGGVPLGPVRLSVIREKALAGAVDGDSLVWREGFDEWLPLKNFPELLEIVTQAQSTRVSTPARRISSTGFAVVQAQVPPSARVPSSARVPPLAVSTPARPVAREPEPPGVDDPPPAVAGSVAAFTVAGTPAAPTPPTPAARPAPATPAVSAPAAWPGAPGGARGQAAGAPVEVLADPFAAEPAAPGASAPKPEPAAPSSANVGRAAGGVATGGSPFAAASAGGGVAAGGSPLAASAGGGVAAGGSPFASAHAVSSPPVTAPAAALSSVEPAPLVATPGSLVETVAPRRRSGMSPLAYAFIAMAAAFGGVSAYVLLSPKQPPPVQVVTAPAAPIQQPASLPTAAPPPPPSVDPETPPAETASPRSEVAAPGRPGSAASQRPQPEKPVASGSSAPIDRSGFGAGVPGPSSGPGAQGAGSGLSQLSQGEISSVVESNRPSVRRHCWQPALDARASNASTTARVSASVVIGASGAVQSVSAGGSEKDYPGLSSCIASRIKSWRFPPSSGSTPVTIPFVFAAQ
ncbi:GYF domain-containing protein [Sorangium sp. So ce1389]|uniref:GYF domain-containing protein n=1 Tax=Sorangium sp. So ce1389 TaxID=3133336 RepID=UPI003F62D9FD